MKKDVMIDLETLGTRYDAAIIQIGACYFDRNTGEIGEVFNMNIKYDSETMDKFSVDYDTFIWWIQQSSQAHNAIASKSITPRGIKETLELLHTWLEPQSVIWSHATFDMPILVNAFSTFGLKFPIPFRNMRDIRTLMDIADHHSDTDHGGVHHRAIDDAMFQAKYVSEAFQKLRNEKRI